MKWNFIFRNTNISVTFDIRKKIHTFSILEDGLLTQVPSSVSECPHSPQTQMECFQKLCNLEQGLWDLDVFTWYDKGIKVIQVQPQWQLIIQIA